MYRLASSRVMLCTFFLLLCGLLRGDLLAVRLGSSLERRQGKYEKCDDSNGCGQPAPRNPAFRLLRFVLLRQRRTRKRWCFRNWFDFKRGGIPPLTVQQEIIRILDSFTELTAELAARRK